jgi:Na+-driven multidrug efflux pump
VIVLIPLLIVLPRVWGLDGVWAAGPIADAVSSVLTAIALVWQLRSMKAPARA